MFSPEIPTVEKTKNDEFSPEKIREKMAVRIEKASKNPIDRTRLIEVEDQINKSTDSFVETGRRSDDESSSMDAIEAEIRASSAIADNIIEFKEILQQLSEKYGTHHKWADTFLAHENAHANVAEATDHEWVGYATLFIKDAEGNLSSIQPLIFTKPRSEWGPEEQITKNIEVTEAPEKYGDKLSEGDVEAIARDRQRLEKIKMNEERDLRRMSEIRNDLGV